MYGRHRHHLHNLDQTHFHRGALFAVELAAVYDTPIDRNVIVQMPRGLLSSLSLYVYVGGLASYAAAVVVAVAAARAKYVGLVESIFCVCVRAIVTLLRVLYSLFVTHQTYAL